MKEKVIVIWHSLNYRYAVDWIEKNDIDKKIIEKMQRGKTYTSAIEILRIFWKDKTLPIEAPINGEALDFMVLLIEKK